MTRTSARTRLLLHRLFDIGVVAKGIDAVLEIVGGGLLFFISPSQLDHFARALTQHELAQDPHDLLATYILHSSQGLAGAKVFGALYLLSHGAIKIGLVTALLLKRLWAYPLAIVAFLLFVIYQLSRYAHTGAIELLILSVLDIVVILLTWFEYQRLRTAQGVASAPQDPS